jgi:hypothetical protein
MSMIIPDEADLALERAKQRACPVMAINFAERCDSTTPRSDRPAYSGLQNSQTPELPRHSTAIVRWHESMRA